MQVIEFERFISKDEEHKYFTISFEAPENAERMDFYRCIPAMFNMKRTAWSAMRRETSSILR